MADGSIVLPPEARPQIQPNEAGMASQLGVPLRPRPSDIPVLDGDGTGPEIRIDVHGDDGSGVSVGDDGSVSLAPAVHGTRTQDQSPDFGENLAIDTVSAGALASVAADSYDGVTADIQSRTGWTEQYKTGIDLLGLKIEAPADSASGGKGISRNGHPLLIEAMVKYWASANGEMLPAAGPVKVPTIGHASAEEEMKAKDFQDDFNYFLTEVATEYGPDTSSMLMHQGYCGIGYKKIYRDPIRQRPTSQSCLAPDIIVSEEATDLDTALRVTHSIMMLKGQLRRMQLVGQYRNVDLGVPSGEYGLGREAQRAINLSQGLTPVAQRPQDQPYEIWEIDTELDPDYFALDGYYERRAPEGLPLPYKLTIDKSSMQVLGLWRNWRPGDGLYKKRNMYVKYGMMPGLGYHNWGFLQILGNQARALRSILRIMIDAGMYSNFPGGVKLGGGRTSTNEIAPRPGEFVDIDFKTLGPNPDINKLIMALPYKGPDAVFVQLYEIIKNDAMRLAGTVQIEVGEGRSNLPVGTVLAMIEQQVQVMASVHKNNHRSQKEELHKLRELFAENPEDLSRLCRGRPATENREQRMWRLAEEFTDLNLQPASDPNVPSHTHAIMLANVIIMLAQQSPHLYDVVEANRYALQTIGADPDRFLIRPDQQPPPQPDPKTVAKQADIAQKDREAAIDAQVEGEKIQVKREELAADLQKSAADNVTRRETSRLHAESEIAKIHHQAAVTPPADGIGGIGGV